MRILKTRQLEAGILTACARNARVLVNTQYYLSKAIRVRTRLLAGVTYTKVLRKDPFWEHQVKIWNHHKQILFMPLHWALPDIVPDNQCMFFAETPLQHTWFETIARKTKEEAILYRPPDWSLHQEEIDLIWPDSSNALLVKAFVEGFIQRDLAPIERDAITESKIPAKHAIVFRHEDMAPFSDMPEKTLRRCLKFFGRNTVSYVPLRPVARPLHSLCERYDAIEQLPEKEEGYRLLRYPTPALWGLVGGGYVQRAPWIYVVDRRLHHLDFGRIAAEMTARRANWWKIMTMVEAAPEI